jgi:Methyltransferase domain
MAPSRAIVLWHSFEHLTAPVAVLRAAAANLEAGGVLLIAAPNPGAFGLRLLGARWAHIDAPRHLQLVPGATLVRLAGEAGLAPLALTGSDRMGRDWNAHAWLQPLVRPGSSALRRRAAFYAGAICAEVLAPIERSGLRGSTYTAVFRKS